MRILYCPTCRHIVRVPEHCGPVNHIDCDTPLREPTLKEQLREAGIWTRPDYGLEREPSLQ